MLRLSTVNKEIKNLGFDCELVKGNGYSYFYGADFDKVKDSCVYVNSLNQLTMQQWLFELKSKLNGN